MKKIITLVITGSLMMSFHVGRAQVFSSGFETWTTTAPIKPTDWVGVKTSFAADSIMQYTSNPHGGTYACKLKNRSTTTHKRLTTQALFVTSGTAYTITFWVKGHGSIRTGIYDGCSTDYGFHYNSYIAINSSTWAQQSQTIAADTTSSAAEFILSVKSTFADLDDIQVDDVDITEGSISTVPIHDIQYATTAPYVSPLNGQPVITGGIVTARNNKGFFMQDAIGPWNGIYVYDSAHAATAGIAWGDSITISGTVNEYLTYTELGNITAITVISHGNTLHPAYSVTKANSTTEELEGVLVILTNMPCVEASGSAAYGEWTVYNGTDSTKMGGLLYKYTTAAVGTNYDITGVVYLAYGGVVRVEPRDANDVAVSNGINEFKQNSISIYPNPVSSNLFLNNIEGTQMIRISNILGETLDNIKVNNSNAAVNVSNLSDGIYFVTLIDKNGMTFTKKFSKE